eukprot:scaffold1055_cov165-Amphora_coffeaeformis.AAC.8
MACTRLQAAEATTSSHRSDIEKIGARRYFQDPSKRGAWSIGNHKVKERERKMKIPWWLMAFTLHGSWLWSSVAGDDNSTDAADDDEDAMVFQHFVAHNKTMTCTADEHARPFNNQVRGVNLGGWMVSDVNE